MVPNPERRGIVFVCESNSGKSQLAAAHMVAISPTAFQISSAGTRPALAVSALVLNALAEIGLEVEDRTPKSLTHEVHAKADVVVVLGGGARFEELEGPRYERWIIEEPSLLGFDGAERMALIRDEIGARVRDLHRRLTT